MTEFKRDGSHLSYCPPVEKWDDWVEWDAKAWPEKKARHYMLVPTGTIERPAPQCPLPMAGSRTLSSAFRRACRTAWPSPTKGLSSWISTGS